MPDHATRAKRLGELIEKDCYKLNEESLDICDPPVVIRLDDDGPGSGDALSVPYRYACATYDGSGSWLEFGETIAELCDSLAGEIQGEVPWAPGHILDLDTGDTLPTKVTVTIGHGLRLPEHPEDVAS